MPKQLLLGTRNPARIDMLRKILQDTAVQVVTLDELGISTEVQEDGQSTQANAEKKARAYYALSGLPTLAIDGGLCIDRFSPEKQPGVEVKRIPGLTASTSEAEVMNYYIQELARVGGESSGTWTGSHALAVSDHQVLTHSHNFVVTFTTRPKGSPAPGRMLDPLMIDPQTGKYYTELALEERPYYPPLRDFVLNGIKYL